jgi:hypothetical protein
MSPNAFVGKTEQPTDEELTVALGPARATWDQLLACLAQEYGANVHEWNCYSPKAGWSLRVKLKARTIVWLGPREGSFMAAFVLGEKAMRAARAGKLPQRIVKIMSEAPKYPEGTGIRLEVKVPKDIETVKKLAAIKLAN